MDTEIKEKPTKVILADPVRKRPVDAKLPALSHLPPKVSEIICPCFLNKVMEGIIQLQKITPVHKVFLVLIITKFFPFLKSVYKLSERTRKTAITCKNRKDSSTMHNVSI